MKKPFLRRKKPRGLGSKKRAEKKIIKNIKEIECAGNYKRMYEKLAKALGPSKLGALAMIGKIGEEADEKRMSAELAKRLVNKPRVIRKIALPHAKEGDRAFFEFFARARMTKEEESAFGKMARGKKLSEQEKAILAEMVRRTKLETARERAGKKNK